MEKKKYTTIDICMMDWEQVEKLTEEDLAQEILDEKEKEREERAGTCVIEDKKIWLVSPDGMLDVWSTGHSDDWSILYARYEWGPGRHNRLGNGYGFGWTLGKHYNVTADGTDLRGHFKTREEVLEKIRHINWVRKMLDGRV